MSDEERCAQYERFKKIDSAFRAGDLVALRAALGEPDNVPKLLLSFGADPDQRGLNDYTPLHMAVSERSPEALKLLLASGANPTLRTRIDDYETPREMAEKAGMSEIAALLQEYEARRES